MPEFLLLEKTIKEKEFSALSNLHKNSFSKGWEVNDFNEIYNSGDSLIFIAKDQEEIIAFLILRKVLDEAEIITICTNLKLRRKGLARTLLEKGLEYLKQNNIKKIFLEVDVTNQAAIKLYKKFKFTEISTRKNYYKTSTGFSDAVLMKLKLI